MGKDSKEKGAGQGDGVGRRGRKNRAIEKKNLLILPLPSTAGIPLSLPPSPVVFTPLVLL